MAINNITSDIENAVGQPIVSPKDFDLLNRLIFSRTGQLVSTHTLKRLWGYLPSNITPRRSTLDILARFIGFSDYEAYQINSSIQEDKQSSPVLSRHLETQNIAEGAKIRLTWHPERICDIRYEGENTFVVENSLNTRLQPGDSFRCSIFIEREPLYIHHLISGHHAPVAYVCGKTDGITFEFLP